MVRFELTEELRKRIENEIRRAFHYLGENNEKLIQETVEGKMEDLKCKPHWEPEEMETWDGVIIGYPVVVDLGRYDMREVECNGRTYQETEIETLNLVVNEEEMQYILKTITRYCAPGTSKTEDACETLKYKKVNLEDIDKKVMIRSLLC